jgi:hypothetical protein
MAEPASVAVVHTKQKNPMRIVLVTISIVVLMMAVIAATCCHPRYEASYPKPYDITENRSSDLTCGAAEPAYSV